MIMIKLPHYILIILFLYSCKSPKDKIRETILYNDSAGYWDYEWLRERAEFYGMTFEFKHNGKLKQYSFSKTKNKRWLFSDYGMVPRLEWDVSNDSIFTFMNYNSKIKITQYNSDTIWLFNEEQKRNDMLIRVKGDLNIE